MTKTVCNCCGEEISAREYEVGITLYERMSYGSRFDGCNLALDLCIDCTDELLGYMATNYAISPIEELDDYEGWGDNLDVWDDFDGRGYWDGNFEDSDEGYYAH